MADLARQIIGSVFGNIASSGSKAKKAKHTFGVYIDKKPQQIVHEGSAYVNKCKAKKISTSNQLTIRYSDVDGMLSSGNSMRLRRVNAKNISAGNGITGTAVETETISAGNGMTLFDSKIKASCNSGNSMELTRTVTQQAVAGNSLLLDSCTDIKRATSGDDMLVVDSTIKNGSCGKHAVLENSTVTDEYACANLELELISSHINKLVICRYVPSSGFGNNNVCNSIVMVNGRVISSSSDSKSEKSSKHVQKVVIDANSSVKDIEFKKGRGEVVVMPGGKLTGTVNGGTVEYRGNHPPPSKPPATAPPLSTPECKRERSEPQTKQPRSNKKARVVNVD